MNLYTESGYIDQTKILNRFEDFIFEIGPRGTGKSYGILKYILDHKLKFILLRRTQTEADLISSEVTNPFKALMRDDDQLQISAGSVNKNMGAFYDLSGGEEKGPPIGYICGLSTFANIRGMDFSDVELIFYDEFIPEKRSRPIKDEFNALLNMYETVNRNRELQGRIPAKLVCAANSNDIANPIFLGLGIVNRIAKMMNKGIQEYRDPDRSLAVYMFMSSPISVQKEDTALYKLARGTEYVNMALRNIFDIDSNSVSSRNLKEFKPVCSVGELVIYKHKSRTEYYAACKEFGTVPEIFSTSDKDRKRFTQKYHNLYMRYLAGAMLFEDETAMVIFEKIFA